MDELVTAVWTALGAIIAAVVPIAVKAIRAWAELARQRAAETVQSRLGEAAARLAAEIAARIATDPEVRAASRAMVQTAGMVLAERFRDLVRERGIPADTLEGIIRGELAKRGVAVK